MVQQGMAGSLDLDLVNNNRLFLNVLFNSLLFWNNNFCDTTILLSLSNPIGKAHLNKIEMSAADIFYYLTLLHVSTNHISYVNIPSI